MSVRFFIVLFIPLFPELQGIKADPNTHIALNEASFECLDEEELIKAVDRLLFSSLLEQRIANADALKKLLDRQSRFYSDRQLLYILLNYLNEIKTTRNAGLPGVGYTFGRAVHANNVYAAKVLLNKICELFYRLSQTSDRLDEVIEWIMRVIYTPHFRDSIFYVTLESETEDLEASDELLTYLVILLREIAQVDKTPVKKLLKSEKIEGVNLLCFAGAIGRSDFLENILCCAKDCMTQIEFKNYINQSDSEKGYTPLYFIVKTGCGMIAEYDFPKILIENYIKIVHSLCRYGADPNAKSKKGKTSVYWAFYFKAFDVADALKMNGAICTKGTQMKANAARRFHKFSEWVREIGPKVWKTITIFIKSQVRQAGYNSNTARGRRIRAKISAEGWREFDKVWNKKAHRPNNVINRF